MDAHTHQHLAHMTHNLGWRAARNRGLTDSPVVRADNTLGWRDVTPYEFRKARSGRYSLGPGTDSALRVRWSHS